MKIKYLPLALAWMVWFAAPLVFAQTYSVTDLGPLNGAPTYATSINDHGVVGGYSVTGTASSRAWVWQSGIGYTDAGSLGGPLNHGTALNINGTLFGTSQDSAGIERGFSFASGTLTDIGSANPGDVVSISGANTGGVIVGTTVTQAGQFSFALASGSFQLFGPLPGADFPGYSAAAAINDNGHIVGTSSWINGGTRAFCTDAAGTPQSIGTLGGNFSAATAINAAGQVVGYSISGAGYNHAFAYFSGAGMKELWPIANTGASYATGINANDDVVGYTVDSSGTDHATIWPACSAPQDLTTLIPPTSGWTQLEQATAIDTGGDIVGYGIIGGQEHAFLLNRFSGPDTQPPVAVMINTPQPAYVGAATLQVNIEFWDHVRVVSATARAPGALRIRGPNNFDEPGTAVSWTTNDSQAVNVDFAFTGPGGTWGPQNNGTYQVYVVPNQVSNRAGLTMPYTVVGSFNIGYQTVPVLTVSGVPATVSTGTPVSLTLAATSSYPSTGTDVFNYNIDWDGDGSSIQTVTGTANTIVQHTYSVAGPRTVRIYCTDPHGILSATVSNSLTVTTTATILPAAVVLPVTVSQVGPVAAAISSSGTMYFVGSPGGSATAPVATWSYLTSGSFTLASAGIGNNSNIFGGGGTDGRGRAIFFGGSDSDNSALSIAKSYPASTSIAAMPGAITKGITTNDGSGRMYVYSSVYNVFYRYTAGASGAGTWAALTPPTSAISAGMSWDGGDRIIFFSAIPWVYSISNGIWSQPLAAAPGAFNRAVLGADGLIYLIGSYAIWTFDPVLNTIAQVATTTYDQSSSFLFTGSDGYIYMIGGGGGYIERFDTRPASTLAPYISSTPGNTTVVQGVPWTYTIAASGKPRPSFLIARGPAGMSVDASSGVVSWIPTLAQAGTQSAVLTATNSVGSAGQLINFTVLSAVPDTTPPSVPGAPVETGSTVSTVDLAWPPATDNVGVTSYVIYKTVSVHSPKGSGGTTYYVGVAATSGTTAQVGGLSAGYDYYFYISAFDAAGNRSPYLGFTCTTSSTSQATITNGNNGASAGAYAIVGQPFTSNTFTGGGIPAPTLSVLSAPAGAVWNSTYFNSGYFTWTPVAGQEGTASFALSSINTSSTATQSYTVTVYPAGTDLVPPTTPASFLLTSVSYTSLTGTWNSATDNVGVAGYLLTATHRDSRLHPPPYNDQTITATVGPTITQATLTGLMPDTSYDVTLEAFDAAGNYSIPTGATAQTPPVPRVLGPSTVTFQANVDGTTTISWPNSGYYWQYTVQSSTDLQTWTPLAPASQWPAYLSSFTFTPSVTGGQEAFYRVVATPAP